MRATEKNHYNIHIYFIDKMITGEDLKVYKDVY